MIHPFFRDWSGPDQPVLGLEEYADTLRHVVGHQRGNPDAEVHEHPGSELLCNALGDNGLRVHGVHLFATR